MKRISAIIAACGRGVSWLILGLVGLTFVVVVLRYGFNLGWIWLQEAITYLHAAVFMLAAAWTLGEDGHVRVDIIYRDASERYRAWVNLGGTVLLLIPFCLFLIIVGWEYVFVSWQRLEGSREAGGLPAVFLLKSLILLMPALLLAQAVIIVKRSVHCLKDRPASVHDA
ncbi:MAG: TRAP transporter small permease subunit [Xanthomonadales bacterium]|nr:TRAP transporter small permease subunit [Xanthomonadales bacterium]